MCHTPPSRTPTAATSESMSSPAEDSTELQTFLRDGISSYEQLETLLLLRTRHDETFSPRSVAAALRVTEPIAAASLDHLCSLSLLDVRIGAESLLFRYSPGKVALAGLVDQLAESHTRNPLAVMTLMNANAIERVRTQARRLFADAFILGRKRDKDG
ncbi:MAG: hypothetical protein RL385_362 [Pseudomonadota bacterium]